MFVRFY